MNPSPGGANKESEGSSPTASSALEVARGSEKAEEGKAEGGDVEVAEKAEDPMDEDTVTPTAVFCIRLKQPRSNLMRKMTVPELCRNFSAVAWCGKLNAIACGSETCARIPRAHLIWSEMRVAGSGSMSGGRILQLLQSGYQEFLRWLSARSNSSLSSNLNFEEKFLSQQPQVPTGWPNLLCVCSVFSSVSVQLHWSQWPPNQSGAASKSSCTSKGLLGAGPSGIMAADAIVTDAGAMHVAGVPIVNPLTVVVWEVTPGTGNGFQATPKATSCPHMILMRVLQSQVGESNGGNHLLSLLSSTTYLENLLPVLVVRSPYRRFGLPQ